MRLGEKYYLTGYPCVRGHLTKHITSNGRCYECSRICAKEYYKRHPDLMREYRRKSSSKPGAEAKHKLRVHKWNLENRHRKRANTARYKAKKREVGGSFTVSDIEDLFLEQDGRCAYSWCRAKLSKGYHIDHRMPLALGGSNDADNIQLLCPTCNLQKGPKHPNDFVRMRRGCNPTH